jgi:hypothetical protein
MSSWYEAAPRLVWVPGPADTVVTEGFVGRIDAPTSKAMLLTDIAAALEFPGWFGHNWDALSDCLRDLSWLPEGPVTLLWTEPEALRGADPAAYALAVDILGDSAARSARPFYPVLIKGSTA